ncbi:hypothetical protein R3P38DRAFT_3302317 [Favolaschia claudopus]|uniref:Uncharacterized protein n=1 Tax=Favolaschia claudopus TaxID=2862362 RepID=A0AAW0EJC1_9AGAR
MSTPTSQPETQAPEQPADNSLTPEQEAAAAISAELAAETAAVASKKRKNSDGDGDDDDPDVLASYKDYGRAYLRLGDPFTPIDEIVQHGIFVETTEEIDYPKMDTKQRKIFDRNTASWEILWRLIGPVFRDRMILLKKNRKLRRRVCSQIGAGLSGSRGEDANTLKKFVIDYLQANTEDPVDPPLPKTTKIERGYNHKLTASLLCPAKKQANDATYEGIANGTIKVTGRMFPRFFYPHDWVYDGENLMDKLFEGHLMIRTGKCILQGPSQALKPPGAHRGNRGNAAKIGARAMTPRLLAYIGIQTLFSISSLDTWQQTDGGFDYEQFYWTIVGLFEDDENGGILENFNHHVFGDVSGRPIAPATADTSNDDDDEDDLETYRAMRAKKARLAAEAEAAATSTSSSTSSGAT